MGEAPVDGAKLRWTVACFAAAALHAAAVVFVRVDSSREGKAIAPVQQAPSIDVELIDAPLRAVDDPFARAEREQAAPREPSSLAKTEEKSSASRFPSRGSLPMAEERATPPPAGPASGGEGGDGVYALDPSEASSPRAPRVNLALGEGDWTRWAPAPAGRAEVAPPSRTPRAPRPVSSTGGLAEALEAHDREVGLGPSGRVLSAARDAAHSDIAPQLGTATFSVTVLSTGQVTVKLLGARSDVDGWQKVANSIEAALVRKRPSIQGGRSGVLVEFELVAEEQWPNGNRAQSEGPKVAVAAPKILGVDEAKEDLARRNPLAADPVPSSDDRPPLRLQADVPGVFLQGRGKVCGYRVGMSLLGPMLQGGCDPSNIGAKPIRVVSTRVLRETML